MIDFMLFGGFVTDRRTDGRTDIGGCRVAFATENCILRILQRDQSVAIIIVSLNFEHFNGVYLCLLHLNSFDIHKIDFALRLLFRKSLELC